MPLKRTSIGRGVVGPESITGSGRFGRYWYEPFSVKPICWDGETANGAGNPAGSAIHVNQCFTGFNTLEYSAVGADATILAPAIASEGGYNWGFDQTLAEGVEVMFGGLTPTHPRVYRAGSEEFYARLLFSSEDISGMHLFFGFRGGTAIQSIQNALESYTDVFGLQILGDDSSAGAAVNIQHCLTGDASDAVTTIALPSLVVVDNTQYELEVIVGGTQGGPAVSGGPNGLTIRFKFAGVEVYAGTLLSATALKYYTPIFRHLHTSDLAGPVRTWRAEGGLAEDRPDGLLVA